MFKNNKVLVIIPARGGSKGIPGKNIKLLSGKPLIYYAIQAGLKSKFADRTIVSTDDLEIAEVAKKCGAEIPFIRPKSLAGDKTPMEPVLINTLKFLEKKENFFCDFVVLVQPTNPFIVGSDIDKAVEIMVKTKTNSCFSVHEVKQRPEWSYVIKNGKVRPYLNSLRFEKIYQRQNLSKIYTVNGGIYAVRKKTLLAKNKVIDKNTSFLIMSDEKSIDIDEPIDFKFAEAIMAEKK